MEDYREIGPPGNGKTRKTGASNLAAVRETTRHVRIHASRVIFRGALGMLALIAPLSDRLIGGQDPIHRPLRAQVMAFVEQRRHDLRRRTVDEARAGEHIEDAA